MPSLITSGRDLHFPNQQHPSSPYHCRSHRKRPLLQLLQITPDLLLPQTRRDLNAISSTHHAPQETERQSEPSYSPHALAEWLWQINLQTPLSKLVLVYWTSHFSPINHVLSTVGQLAIYLCQITNKRHFPVLVIVIKPVLWIHKIPSWPLTDVPK